jgi:hypothetical protein
MEHILSPNLKSFNDKIKVLNQSNNKQITLTAQEAKNLHAEIFDLLNHFTTVGRIETSRKPDEVITVAMDGGNF